MNQIEFQGRSFAGKSLKNYKIIHKNEVVYTKSPLRANPYGIIQSSRDEEGILSTLYAVFTPKDNVNANFVEQYFAQDARLNNYLVKLVNKGAKNTLNISDQESLNGNVIFPIKVEEQGKIALLLDNLDSVITLHQCYYEAKNMKNKKSKEFFVDYFEKRKNLYKEGAIRKVTLKKYDQTLKWIQTICPKLRLCEIDRLKYQEILNEYAKSHEKQTTMDFHHHLKAAILDAVDEGLIEKDPTRKVIIKGKDPTNKKRKYLNQFELHNLLNSLELKEEVSYEWLILLIAKTGLRFSEAIALTPNDFDFKKQTLNVNKTWNYKENGGFTLTKNKSSIRKIQIDWMLSSQFYNLTISLPKDKPIFVNNKIYNSTVNNCLYKYCNKINIPLITIHGLRHTHASLLLFEGVSIASVAKRLGHSSMNTTEKTYLHIIKELENKDIDLVMRSLSQI